MTSSARTYFNIIIIVLFTLVLNSQVQAQIVTPEEHFGFQAGSNNNLFNYDPLIDYLHQLDAASTRLKMVKIGSSSLGKDMYIAFFSSTENINNLDELKEINKRLTFDPDIPDAELNGMIDNGRVFFLATLSMHSGEVSPSQSTPLIAYDLVTTEDPAVLEWLDNVVYMMIPCHNPDGMDMIVNHYNKYKGTKYDGSSLPGVYHKYVGHNINRDFVSLTQSENKAIAAIYNLDWFPQVMVEKHQMGSTGPRYYVPPNHDPIAENIDAGIWNWTGVFGSNIIKDLTAEGLSGISQHYIFDDYWPGSTETCIWKNVIGFLTEGASARYATPIYVEPNELAVYGKGLSEYKKSINMPLPWPGGWWGLEDLAKLEVGSTMSIIKTASANRREILKFRNDLCKREVKKGKTEAPYYYIMPSKQHDESEFIDLVNLLMEHGVDVYQLNRDIIIDNKMYHNGDVVVPLAQAFRPFVKEVMEVQKFPLRHYTPGGEIIRPYDITSWSLPLHRGVKSIEVKEKYAEVESSLIKIEDSFTIPSKIPEEYWAIILDVRNNESFKTAFSLLSKGVEVKRTSEDFVQNEKVIRKGSFLIEKNSNVAETLMDLKSEPVVLIDEVEIKSESITMPRIGLVETYFHDMDAGWTRFIFDNYKIPFKILRPGDFEKLDIAKEFDLLLFPDSRKSVLMSGKYKSGNDYRVSDYPPEYTKGIGKKGLEKIMSFVNKGGIVVSWGGSTELFLGSLEIKLSKDETEEFSLPISNISNALSKKGLYVPGSLVKLKLIHDHPVTLGMEKEIGIFYRGRPVFSTSVPRFDMDRRVIGKFPEENILKSGYAENIKEIGNKTGLVWLKKGKGQLVLFAFSPQFRGSTNVSYKLLFNSLLLPKI